MRNPFAVTRLLLIASVIGLLVLSCNENKSAPSLVLSPRMDSIMKDTAHVSYIIDSLKKEYFAAPSDTQRINFLNELSQQYRIYAREFSDEAFTQSQKTGYRYGLADALCRKGIVFYRHSEYDSARVYYNQSQKIAEEIHSDKLVAQALGWKGDAYRMEGQGDSALSLLQQAKSIADQCGAKSISGFCLSGIGSMYYISGEYDKSIDYTNRALLVAVETNDKFRMGFCLSSLGKVYDMQGQHSQALTSFHQALDLAKKVENKTLISFCLNSLGDIYRQQDDTMQATYYFLQALDMALEIGDKSRTAYAYAYLGDIARAEGKFERARAYYRQSLDVAGESEDTTCIIYVYNGIADSYFLQDKLDSTEYFLNYSLSLCDSANDREQIANNTLMLASVACERKNYQAAIPLGEKALAIAKEIQIPQYEGDAADALYKAYKGVGRTKEALEMYEYSIVMRDSLNNLETVRKFQEEQYKAKENDLKEEQAVKDARAESQQLLDAQKLEQQSYVIYFAAGGIVLVLVCLVIAVRGYRNKRKANEAIQQQKEQVEHQKEIIEEKNKEIVDSINYAQRIQTAIFPPEKKLAEVFGESFVLFLPKDIVSGDFYWMEKAKDGSSLLAAVDCTGHGVPGALVSVVGNNALNRTVREFGLSDPGKILDKLNELVAETFAQSESEVKDGMDISLLSLNNNQLKWAGANNNLWLMRSGNVIELKADRRPIGKYETSGEFTTKTLTLQSGDTVYIFTDGYADQFGGEKGKKFKYKALQDLLLSMQNLTMQEQKEKLEKTFTEWRGNLEQVDDVLILGLKI